MAALRGRWQTFAVWWGPEMKKRPNTKSELSAAGQAGDILGELPKQDQQFHTTNPRHARVLAVLLRRPLPRQELDTVAGCANGPELVADLRRAGLTVDCERITFIDRDGKKCRPGIYMLTTKDRRKVHQWIARGGLK